MNQKMDIVFAPELKAPKLLITMKRFNHVYFGLYRGFDKDTLQEVVRYFWAEHNNGDSFFRCLVTKDHELTHWSLDAIGNHLILDASYRHSKRSFSRITRPHEKSYYR